MELAELPAQPCLSSRIKTGLRIEEHLLPLINRVEHDLSLLFRGFDVRCRVELNSIRVEISQTAFESLSQYKRDKIHKIVQEILAETKVLNITEVSIAPYVRGSAFVEPMQTKKKQTKDAK